MSEEIISIKDRILIIANDEIAIPLRNGLEDRGYEVFIESSTNRAVFSSIVSRPIYIFLDNDWPNINAAQIHEVLRYDLRTCHIPVGYMIKAQKVVHEGLLLTPYDYITKPVDPKEAHLYIEYWIRRLLGSMPTLHPISRLPTGKLIEECLKDFQHQHNWTIGRLMISNLSSLSDSSDEAVSWILNKVAQILMETIAYCGTKQDFVGHLTDSEFIVGASSQRVKTICQKAISEFATVVSTHRKEIGTLSVSLTYKM